MIVLVTFAGIGQRLVMSGDVSRRRIGLMTTA
jgi:hypothetical protein